MSRVPRRGRQARGQGLAGDEPGGEHGLVALGDEGDVQSVEDGEGIDWAALDGDPQPTMDQGAGCVRGDAGLHVQQVPAGTDPGCWTLDPYKGRADGSGASQIGRCFVAVQWRR